MISFFPALAESKGMDQSIIGVLFGLDPLIGLPASILTGRLMFKLGRKKVFIFGIFCSAVGFTLLSTIHYFRNDVACLLAFSARVVSGLGTATYMTAGQSLLLNQCPEQAESLVAKFEAVGGLGFLVGPVVGFFFSSSQVGCFGICGLLLFVYGLVNLLLLEVHENVDEQGEDYGISGFIKKPKIFLEFMAQMMMLTCLGYLSAVIERYLNVSFDIPDEICGLLFSIYTISYFSASLLEPKVSKLLKSEGRVVCLGTIISSLSFILISQFLLTSWQIVLLGLSFTGIGNAFMISKTYLVPTIARILKSANSDYGYPKSEKLVDTVSSLTLFFSNSGEIIGPFLASFLVKTIGYHSGFLIMSSILIIFFFFYLKFTDVLEKNQLIYDQIEIVDLSLREEKESNFKETINYSSSK